MNGWQLGWVLLGVVVVLIAISALMRTRARRRAPAAAARAPETAAVGARAPAISTGAAASASWLESAELRSARLQALQTLQALAFSAPLAPAPGALKPAATATPATQTGGAGAAGAAGAAGTSGAARAAGNPASAHEQAVAVIRQTLANVTDRPNYAPRRPLLLPKLMQAMNDNEVSRRELSRIIATDPALAGGLLRLANSPFYRLQPEPVESLDRAIALLGLEGMRSLIAAALLQPVFRVSGGMFLQFGEITWEHTLHSAAAAEAHAAVLENSDPFAAQLLALIMGLATIVVFRVATDEFLARQLRPNPAALAALIDVECTSVARRIAASWELSERIDTALAEQGTVAGTPAGALGRSLQMGRFIGALTLLHAHGVMDEEQVLAALKTAGTRGEAFGRIWTRLRPPPATAD